eukprot:513724-Prymnesium_polylepis.1
MHLRRNLCTRLSPLPAQHQHAPAGHITHGRESCSAVEAARARIALMHLSSSSAGGPLRPTLDPSACSSSDVATLFRRAAAATCSS